MLRIFFEGIRPKTLVAAIIPPLCAHSLYVRQTSQSDYLTLLLCIGLALSIQIATNFYNDAIDFLKGADKERVGPERITSQRNANVKNVFLLGHVFILIAFLFGIPLVVKGGAVFFLLGVISLFFAYGYTGGPYPLAYLGLGELFVFLFFGLLATCGSYYLFSQTVTLASLVLGSIIGLLSSVLIAVNNYRDRKTDILVNKRTLATKMADKKYLLLMDIFIFLPYLLSLFFVFTIHLNFFIVIFAVGLGHRLRFLLHNYNEEQELNTALALGGKQLLFYGVLFSLGCLW